MAEPREITMPDGKKAMAKEMAFDTVKEDWNEYKLEDGVTVRIKAVVHTIFRIVDAEGKPESTESGEPSILVRSANSVMARE